MKAERAVAGHYGKSGLEEKILAAVARAGIDVKNMTAIDLAPVDEFHVGGIDATKELAAQMELRKGMGLLDVGCGIGGPARYFAGDCGCKVTGLDLTEEFVHVATTLTRLVKLDAAAEFQQGSALQMPFEAATFDGAYMIHVGMNLADKTAVFRQVRRVLKPGALFTIFDIMRLSDGAISYPVPWASTADTSFVETVAGYANALQSAGFRVERQRDRREFGIQFTERIVARMSEGGPPALGLHLLMGEKAPLMVKNALAMMQQALLAPVEIFARAV
jgi:ubiquinone/menaquinone biosynthesis C-methylase UbiE